MSGNLGPQTSTKGETTSKTATKSGYDRLDINKLYKKTTEPVTKAVPQKHGMQSLGKALPARRSASVKQETSNLNDTAPNSSSVSVPAASPPVDLGQPVSPSQQPKWTNSSPQLGPTTNVLQGGPHPHVHEKNWNGPDVQGSTSYQSQRFAQEFPSLDAGSDTPRTSVNTTQNSSTTGMQNSSKSQDNQYGPGPILRPQTEGSWTQGGARGSQRGQGQQNPPSRESGLERPNLGGPTPPPMSLGQAGQGPPPLGTYSMQFRGMAPHFMYPNGPQPGPGGYYPPPGGQGMPLYGMPVPPGAPNSREQPDSHRESNRAKGPSQMRPTQQFAVKPIIKQEDLKRMDDIDQEGSWSSVRDEIDYNKKIYFSDDEDEKQESKRKSTERKIDEDKNRDQKPFRILGRQQSSNERESSDRYEALSVDSSRTELEREDDWNKPRNTSQYDHKDRTDRSSTSSRRPARDSRDEDWRGGGSVNRFEEDPRSKKIPPSTRSDPRSAQEHGSKQFSNLPPRLLRQQHQQQNQHGNQPYSSSQRRTPSPPGSVNEYQRDRESEKRPSTTQYRILGRTRGDSESSSTSFRDKRISTDCNSSRSFEKDGMRKDATKDKNQSTESLKEKMENLDVNVKNFSSWADQVEEEPEEGTLTALKPEIKEERTMAKRVYIQQTKVENMATVKTETQPEPKIQSVAPKLEKLSEKNKASAVWDREEKVGEEKSAGIETDKSKQPKTQNSNTAEYSDKKTHDKNSKELDKQKDRYGSTATNSSQDDKVWGSHDRPRPNKWGATTDYRNDSRTPERDTAASSGRSSAATTDISSHSTSTKEISDKGSSVHKSRSSEIIKEPEKDKESKGIRDDYHKPKESNNIDKRSKNFEDDNSEARGNVKGGRNRERLGHGVYQPRGSWASRPDGRGKSSRGGNRDYYDSRPRKNEYDRDREDRHPKEHEVENKNNSEKDAGLVPQDDVVKDFGSGASTDEDKSKKDGDGVKKGIKSPRSSKGGSNGARLQGYGPPSDRPFSTVGSIIKEDDGSKDKHGDTTVSSSKVDKQPSSGPVPLMELGDISPPNMLAGRGRHHGSRGNRGGNQPTQDRSKESFPFRGGGSKRGRNDAKPLMSINSNELEKQEEDGDNPHEDEAKKIAKKKDGVKPTGSEKHRQNQNEARKDRVSSESANQDSSNLKSKSGKMENEPSGVQDSSVRGSAADNVENVDNDGQMKRGLSKEKLNLPNKNTRNDNKQSQLTNKERRSKQSSYDASHARSAMPPRFQQKGCQFQYPNSKPAEPVGQEGGDSSGSWDKTPGPPKTEVSQQQSQITSQHEPKDSLMEAKAVHSSISTSINPASSIMDCSGGPLKTMIFENRNFKNGVSKSVGPMKAAESKDSGLELTKDIGLSFGKDTGGDGHDLDFGSNYDDQPTSQSSQISNYLTSKPMPIGQSRNFQQHQPSPVSPLAKDLTEKIQSVRQVWEKPAMPSVAEQSTSSVTDETSFHSAFVGDTFKGDSTRDYSSSLQQSAFTQGPSSSISAISKPESSTSPSSASLRQVKPPQQQQTSMDNHVGMSSSPFAYSMPQHQPSAFGHSAIPSPPTAMVYGNSQSLAHTGMYQAFPIVDSSQVMNTASRSQYGQFATPQGTGGGPFGLTSSLFMAALEPSYQSLSSYQQHSHHQQHSHNSQSGPNQSNRSPGPMSTSGATSGVMTALKSQSTTAHPNMGHPVMGNQNQKGYTQMSHHHTPHHQLPPVGHVPTKPSGFNPGGLSTQNQQMYIPFDPNQVLNYGQNYVSSGLRNAPPGGPPPSATPPIQGMQTSSTYYSGNAANQVFPGSNQGAGMQQLHVAVQNPQLQNLQSATQQYGQQFPIGYNQIHGYNQQAASTVSALNLSGQLIRPPSGHSHYSMKSSIDMVQQNHGMKPHDPMMNPTWSAQGFPLNQTFHGTKPGGQDRNSGLNLGNQRKGNHP